MIAVNIAIRAAPPIAKVINSGSTGAAAAPTVGSVKY